jgi:membrane-bound lytic murein transglycosylase D
MSFRPCVFLLVLGCTLAVVAGCGTVPSQTSTSSGRSASTAQSAGVRSHEADSSMSNARKSELPIPDHPSIETWVREFSGRKHQSFQTQLERAASYTNPAEEIFGDRGLPKDLIYVALVESGFTPKARSKAKAVGMYQFIPETGKRFGLEQNQWIDERCHPMKAARAAANYLSALYDQFGSWPLALAAYNAGEKAVQSNLDRSGLKTFWELAENGYLPAETRDYVPKVLATVKIVRNVNRYGFYLGTGRHVPKQETVPIPGGVKLAWVGKQIGVSEDYLQTCNPELCRPVTPPDCSSYKLCVPEGTGESVLAALIERAQEKEIFQKSTVTAPSSSTLSYVTKRGDTWQSVARQNRCSAKELAGLNGLTLSRSFKTGQALKIPAGNASAVAVSPIKTKESKDKPNVSHVASRKSTNAKEKSSETVHSSKRPASPLTSISAKSRTPIKAPVAQKGPSPSQKLVSGNRLTIASNDQDSKLASKKSTKKTAKQ